MEQPERDPDCKDDINISDTAVNTNVQNFVNVDTEIDTNINVSGNIDPSFKRKLGEYLQKFKTENKSIRVRRNY